MMHRARGKVKRKGHCSPVQICLIPNTLVQTLHLWLITLVNIAPEEVRRTRYHLDSGHQTLEIFIKMISTLQIDLLCRLHLMLLATLIHTRPIPTSSIWLLRLQLQLLSWSKTSSSIPLNQSLHKTSLPSNRNMNYHLTKPTSSFSNRSNSKKPYSNHLLQPLSSKSLTIAIQLTSSRSEKKSSPSGMTWSDVSQEEITKKTKIILIGEPEPREVPL